jgi:hypothetical protein
MPAHFSRHGIGCKGKPLQSREEANAAVTPIQEDARQRICF